MLYICSRNSVKREINMKKITILILALCALNVNAQNAQKTQYSHSSQLAQKTQQTQLVQKAQQTQLAQKTQQAQNDTLQFMTAYRQFAAFVEKQPALTKPVADSLIVRQDSLMRQYRRIKPQLTGKQVEEYNTLKGRFTKKLLQYRGDRLGEGLEATGDSIAKATGRVGSAVGGFFKGLFSK